MGLDLQEIRYKAVQLRFLLQKKKITTDLILLFGSAAKGSFTEESDIDLAVVSKDFGKDRINEGALLNYLVWKIDPRIEVVPISLKEYLSKSNISPILNEIRKSAIPLI